MRITKLIHTLLAKVRKQRTLAGQDPFILLSAFGPGLLEAEVEDEPPQLGLRTVVGLAQCANELAPAV
jgi:hypothetical protein